MELNECRLLLNEIDAKMKDLFLKRMDVVKEVALYKKENNLPIFDEKREAEMKERLTADLDDMKDYYLDFLEEVLKISKQYQTNILK